MKKFWESHFLLLEGILAMLLSVGFIVWSAFFNRNAALGELLENNRKEIYGTLATIFGSLLGFVITTVSIIIIYSDNVRLRVVSSSKHYADLWNTYISGIKGLALATICSLIGLIFDRNTHPFWPIFYVNFTLMVFIIFRLGRSIWIFDKILKILIKQIPTLHDEEE